MRSLLAWVLVGAFFASAAFAQTFPTAEAKRFTRGVDEDSFYQSAVIPADQQRGVLNLVGNNSALYGSPVDGFNRYAQENGWPKQFWKQTPANGSTVNS